MPRIAYVNGRYLPHAAATVHVEDRGYQFADGVYEVIAVHKGGFLGEMGHMDRLEHSLSELRIVSPMARETASRKAPTIPGRAAGRTTCRIVSDCVAPNA